MKGKGGKNELQRKGKRKPATMGIWRGRRREGNGEREREREVDLMGKVLKSVNFASFLSS